MVLFFAQLLFWIANLADWYVTKRIMLDGGTDKELSPIINWAIRIIGDGQGTLGPWIFWYAELALLGLKVLVGVLFFLLSAPAIVWGIYGILLSLVALSNKYGILTKIIKFFKRD